MDSITQLTLGAAVGYAVSGKSLGRKALLWGAIAGTIPDLDFLVTLPFKDDFLFLKWHRGFTHSLVFSVLGTMVVHRLCKQKTMAWLFFWGFLTHSILDVFTSWGTQIGWPLSYRMALNAIYIVDPFYTIPLLLSVIVACCSRVASFRRTAIVVGLMVSSLYLGSTLLVKYYINHQFEELFHSQGLSVTRYITRPTAFNIILWSATAETEHQYHYAMISLFDSSLPTSIYSIEKKHQAAQTFTDKRSQELIGYTQGYYTSELYQDGVLIHDFRYGFLGDPFLNGEHYVFSYYLHKDARGKTQLDIENPRPTHIKRLLLQLWDRLKGI